MNLSVIEKTIYPQPYVQVDDGGPDGPPIFLYYIIILFIFILI